MNKEYETYLKNKIENLEDQIEIMKEYFEELEHERRCIENECYDLENKISDLEEQIEVLKFTVPSNEHIIEWFENPHVFDYDKLKVINYLHHFKFKNIRTA